MRQRKKITVLFMVVTMALSMAACGNDKDFLNTDNAGNAQTGKAEETDRANSNAEDEKQDAGKQILEAEDMATATIEETVLVENNSDQDISVTSNTMKYSCNAINGYMYENLPAGKK